MNKIIKNILTIIEKKGYEAYLIGGYVRDLLLGKSSYDIDICTNATPKELITIFPKASTKNLGGISFKIKEYNFEITTYREEIKYKNRKPIEYNYTTNLISDLQRRDFTINTICMNKKGEIIDLLKGIDDLSNLKIRMVGNIDIKLNEDPLRILRAIRLATILNFNIETNLYKAILKYKDTIKTLSNTRIKEELDKILLSPNVKKGLNILEETGILKLLKIEYQDLIPIKSIEGMYSQLTINYNLPFTKPEKENITNLKKIIASKEVTKATIYKYGLLSSRIAGEILNINQKEISKMYKELPIKERKDINIKSEEIIKVLNLKQPKKLSIIYRELENLIISGKIRNKRNDITKYLINNKTRWLT